MNIHLKYICASFLIFISGMMFAQNNGCVAVEAAYSLAVGDSSKLNGKASLTFQDDAFHLVGDGFEIYCDGSDVWTLDSRAKEVYVESLSADYEGYMDDAASKLSAMNAGSEADFMTPDGQDIHLKIISIKKSDRKDVSSFRPTEKFDSSWVIVDLR